MEIEDSTEKINVLKSKLNKIKKEQQVTVKKKKLMKGFLNKAIDIDIENRIKDISEDDKENIEEEDIKEINNNNDINNTNKNVLNNITDNINNNANITKNNNNEDEDDKNILKYILKQRTKL